MPSSASPACHRPSASSRACVPARLRSYKHRTLPRVSAPTTTHTTTAVYKRGTLRCARRAPVQPFMRMGRPHLLLLVSASRRQRQVVGVGVGTLGRTEVAELGERMGARRAVPMWHHFRRRARRIRRAVGATLGSMARISTLRG